MNPQLQSQIQAVTDTISKIVLALTGFLASLPLLGAALTAVVATIGGFGLALRSATAEASALARSLSQMRAANGYSFGQGYDIQRRYGAIGMSQSDTASLFSRPGNNAFGFAARGVNPMDLAGIAGQYQSTAASGIFGRQLANSRLNSQFGGSVPDSFREAVSNFSPGQIRGQQAYSDRINGALGINPSVLKEYVVQLALLQARIGTTFDAIKVKFGVALLPLFESVLGRVSDHLVSNADKIGETIQRVAESILQLPATLLRFGAGILRGGAFLLEGISAFAKGMASNVKPILSVFDAIIRIIGNFADAASRIGGFVIQVVEKVLAFAQKIGVPQALQALGGGLTKNPNDSDADKGSNQIIGGAAAVVATNAALALRGRRAAPGGGGGGGGGGPSLLGRIGRTLGRGVNFVRGVGSAIASGSAGAIAGVGLAVGGLGYEGLRKANAFGMGSLPSSFQMARYGYNRMTGVSERDAALVAMGYGPNAAANAARARAGQNPVSSSNPMITAMQNSNLAGNAGLNSTLSGFLDGIGNSAGGGAETLRGLADSATAGADNWKAEMLKILGDIEKRAAGTEKNTNKDANREFMDGLSSLILRFGARVAAEIANDSALNVLHTSGGQG